jgi:hypothetical protein
MVFAVKAQLNEPFPYLEGETLTNESLILPKDVSGKYSLLGLAFSKRSEKDLKSWYRPTYQTFIYKPESPSLFGGNYDVNTYFIPMFSGVKKAAYGKAMKEMKEKVDPKLHANILFYKGSLKDYKDQLNFDRKDVPYFFVLDPEGKIVYATYGRYTSTKMQEIVDAVEEALDWN